jgi:LysR family hydrogen peroxide-inducible transcriptional activator
MTISAMSPHPFTLRQLQYVLAVADLLSFRRAAEVCHVSQPSLSTQIQHVEDGLGVRLFERDRRRVLLTPAGHAVVERARRVVQEADALVAAATQAGDPLNGTLRIGVIPTVSPYLLPSAAPALRKAHPRLTTIWVEDKTEALVTALDAGSLDGALLALEAELGDVEHDTVAIDPFVLAAAPGDPLLERAGAMTPRALKGASAPSRVLASVRVALRGRR